MAAHIALEDRTYNSITVYIDGLDSSYTSDDNRIAWYYIKKSSESNYPQHSAYHFIPRECESTYDIPGPYTFEALDDATKYDIKIEITNITGYDGIVTLESSFWTKNFDPDLISFTTIRTCPLDTGVFLAHCFFSVDTVDIGDFSYEIYVRSSGTSEWYLKDNEHICNVDIRRRDYSDGKYCRVSGEMDVKCYADNYSIPQQYDFKLVFNTSGQQITATVNNVTLSRSVISEFTAFSGDMQSDGTFYPCYTSVLNNSTPNGSNFEISLYDYNGNLLTQDTMIYSIEDGEQRTDSFGIYVDPGTYIAMLRVIYDLNGGAGEGQTLGTYDIVEYEFETEYPSPLIEDFSVQDSVGRTISFYAKISNFVVNITTYEIYTSTDNVNWDMTTSGEITSTDNYYSINFNSDGMYYIKLVVYTDGKKATKTISCMVSEVTKPTKWKWTTNIAQGATVPMDSKGFHPVTAIEWNEFTDKINEVRAYLSKTYPQYSNKYGFTYVKGASNGYNSNPTVFTPAIYNEAVITIKDLSYYAGEKYTMYEDITGMEISAALFLNLSNQLNFLIDNL